MGVTKEHALGPSARCAVQNGLGAAASYRPVGPTRAGTDEGILHRVGGGLFSRGTGKPQALAMQALHLSPRTLYSQAEGNSRTQTTLYSTLSYMA